MEILVVGNYCHDTLVRPSGNEEVLGGSSSYISMALAAKKLAFEVVAKVGEDFRYSSQVMRPAMVIKEKRTSHFIDTFSNGMRLSQVRAVGPQIYPEDLPRARAKIGIACGVLNEILPETLIALREQVDYLIVDVQGLIRQVNSDGSLQHLFLKESDFLKLLPLIDVLKANRFESQYLKDISFQNTKLVITDGSQGSVLVESGNEVRIPSPEAQELDATGAGDSYIAGFAIGMNQGLDLKKSIRLGNEYGAYAVQVVGVPDFRKIESFRTLLEERE